MFTYPVMSGLTYSGTLLNGLEAWWSLDEASGNRVDSHNGYICTPSGTTASAAGKVGNALSLAGTGYVGRANISALDFSGDFTAAVWVKPTAYVGGGGIIGQMAYSTSGWGMWQFNASVNCFVGGGYTSIVNVNTGSWWLLIMQYVNATSALNLYKNNLDAGNSTKTRTRNGSVPFNIGSYNNGTGLEHNGLIDEVALWSRVLTSDERTELYNSGSGISYPG